MRSAPSAGQIDAIVKGARQVATTIEENEKEPDKARNQMSRTEKLAAAYGLKSCLLS